MALENGVHDQRAAIAVVKSGEYRRRASAPALVPDIAVDVEHDIAEGVAPRLLMTARQMRIGAGRRIEQRRILEQDAVGAVAMADPQFVLALLIPAQRAALAVDLEPKVVLVSRTQLADRHRTSS